MRRNKNIVKITIVTGWWGKEEFLLKKSFGKPESFIHDTKSIRKLLPVGHRFRGDVYAQ